MVMSVVRFVAGLATASLFAAPAWASIDMTGDWIFSDTFNGPQPVQIIQSGTDLELRLDMFGGTTTGTIDPETGVFSTPGLVGTVTPDGNRMSGTATVRICRPFGCTDFSFAIVGQRASTIVCGNSVPDLGEACDDGNDVDGDGCDHDCSSTRCGNGIVTDGEECDDGNFFEGDGCNNDCTPSRCGDGIHSPIRNEFCDDGNLIDGDGCDSNCTVTACGNGIATTGEACDQGAENGDDCCTSGCALVDPDADGVCTADDICPAVADPTQRDTDGDGLGDACDPTPGQAFEVSRVSVKPKRSGTVLKLRARGMTGAMPESVVFVNADSAVGSFVLSSEPGWATLACTTSARTGVTSCTSSDKSLRWRSAAPSRPSKTASLTVRTAATPASVLPPRPPIRVIVSQEGRSHEDDVERCDPRPDRLVCRE